MAGGTDDGDFERPIVTVDVVLLTLLDDTLHVALPRRPRPPFEGSPALVGGYVHVDEDADTAAAAARILRDKARVEGLYIEQLATFSGPARDPRGWSISVAYLALVPAQVLAAPGHLDLTPVDRLPDLPFDHAGIVAAAVARLRGKGAYSTLPARLLPPVFTLPEMQAVYEKVMGIKLDKSAFRRKVAAFDLVEEIEGKRRGGQVRPSTQYVLRAGIGDDPTLPRSLV